MQKYIITDGKRFVSKISSKRNKMCNSAAFALELSYRAAKNVLLTDETLCGFYMEGVDDFIKITKDDLLDTKKSSEIKENVKLNSLTSESVLQDIEEVVQNLCDIKIPDKRTLLTDKDKLVDALSYYDKVLSDIVHWGQDNEPPAHIRTKVYGYLHKYRKYHSEIKEKIRYVDILMDFYDNKCGFSDLMGRLKGAQNKPYKANTPIYAELDALLA